MPVRASCCSARPMLGAPETMVGNQPYLLPMHPLVSSRQWAQRAFELALAQRMYVQCLQRCIVPALRQAQTCAQACPPRFGRHEHCRLSVRTGWLQASSVRSLRVGWARRRARA